MFKNITKNTKKVLYYLVKHICKRYFQVRFKIFSNWFSEKTTKITAMMMTTTTKHFIENLNPIFLKYYLLPILRYFLLQYYNNFPNMIYLIIKTKEWKHKIKNYPLSILFYSLEKRKFKVIYTIEQTIFFSEIRPKILFTLLIHV